jgi:hypothetical protein
LQSLLERLPAVEAGLPGDELLRIAELEAVGENLGVAQVTEARQHGPDLRRDRIVAGAMPSQDELCLFS